jgi:3-oxoacyl-[acyl-carrier protein] reductase
MLELSNGVRAGLTGAVATLARTASKNNVTINNLLPGQHETDRLTSIIANNMKKSGKPEDDRGEGHEGAHSGRPFRHLGRIRPCLRLPVLGQSGFITGQNLVADGGAYPGTL